jgi:uncharacterized membrane protein YdfJ with MMPL/SSD domain
MGPVPTVHWLSWSRATAADLVSTLRSAVHPLATSDASVAVAGNTAVGVDVSNKLTSTLPKYLLVVVLAHHRRDVRDRPAWVSPPAAAP